MSMLRSSDRLRCQVEHFERTEAMVHNDLDFDRLYATFHPKIRRYLARKVGETEAEDLTQVVFLRVSQALGAFRGESSVATWIYRIAANVATDRIRSLSCGEGRHREVPADGLSTPPDRGEMGAGETSLGADHTLILNEMNECIRGLVNRLPEHGRTIIKLSEYDGFKNSEIAHMLGTSLANVKIRLHRARRLLKEDFTSHCRVYRDERNELVCDPKQCP